MCSFKECKISVMKQQKAKINKNPFEGWVILPELGVLVAYLSI